MECNGVWSKLHGIFTLQPSLPNAHIFSYIALEEGLKCQWDFSVRNKIILSVPTEESSTVSSVHYMLLFSFIKWFCYKVSRYQVVPIRRSVLWQLPVTIFPCNVCSLLQFVFVIIVPFRDFSLPRLFPSKIFPTTVGELRFVSAAKDIQSPFDIFSYICTVSMFCDVNWL